MSCSVDIVWLEPSRTLDQVFLHDMVDGKVWKTLNWFPLKETTIDKVEGGAVVVVPGQFWSVEQVNKTIRPLDWVLIAIVADEENLFEADRLSHPNMKLWVQTPRANKDYGDATLFGVGYGHAAEHRELKEKTNDIFLSAQDTHERRHSMFDILSKYLQGGASGVLNRTEGFTQGFDEDTYFNYMNMSKIAPAPAGACSPDSFRLYEALESGAIPIADDVSPRKDYNSIGYWNKLFPDKPFPVIGRDEVAPIIDELRKDFQHKANKVFSWWIQQKKNYVEKFYSDIDELAGREREPALDEVTAIVTVSPWKDNPSTEIFEKCIKSIRDTFGSIDIVVTFDGVREEQASMRDAYEEFVRRALYLCNEDGAILPIVFDKHVHQVGATREALKKVQTNLILFVEGDTALTVDPEEALEISSLVGYDYDLIRFYHFDGIPDEHRYLMRDWLTLSAGSLVETIQWSQRPHLATKDFYDKIMGYFSDNADCFIEDKIHGVAQTPEFDGRMTIYISDWGATSVHLDGRKGLEKYDERQVF